MCPSHCLMFTVQKMEFSIKDFFSKYDQIRSFLWIWSHLLKKSLTKIFIFCAVVLESDHIANQYKLHHWLKMAKYRFPLTLFPYKDRIEDSKLNKESNPLINDI